MRDIARAFNAATIFQIGVVFARIVYAQTPWPAALVQGLAAVAICGLLCLAVAGLAHIVRSPKA